ncbi:MAG: hypothetical protein HRU36_04310 [Rickettsiales bacterium]|nr:hypothetical protein [Rickettsiales bacterium]
MFTLSWNNTTDKILNYTYDVGQFIVQRIPNRKEILYTIIPYAVLQVPFGKVVDGLASNPSTKSVFRDVVKGVSVITTVFYTDTELGSTGIKYDIGFAAGAIVKPICKLSLIGGAIYAYPILLTDGAADQLGNVFMAANFICEIPTEMLKVASYEYQSDNNISESQLSYWEYMQDNIGNISQRGVQRAIAKVTVSNVIIGKGLQSYFGAVSKTSDAISNFLISIGWQGITGNSLESLGSQRGLFEKSTHCLQTLDSGSSSFSLINAYGLVFAAESIKTIFYETIVTTSFASIIRPITDSSIPEWISGSMSKIVSSGLGIVTKVSCDKIFSFFGSSIVCTSAGVFAKVGVDALISGISSFQEDFFQEPIHNDLTDGDAVDIAGDQQEESHNEL